MTKTLTLSLVDEVATALTAFAESNGLDPGIQAVRIIEDRLLREEGLLDPQAKRDLMLSRSLIERAVEQALSLADEDFRQSITFDTVQAVSADPSWLNDYRELVRDDPYKTGNPRKQTINQNLGYFIKKALGARSRTGEDGKPANVKVKGAIIQSYTPLER